MNELAIQIYQKIRASVPHDEIVSILHITDEYTIITTGGLPEEPKSTWIFPFGSKKTAEEFFKHNPPTPEEIEHAINLIEEEISSVGKFLPEKSPLYTLSPIIETIALQTKTTEWGEQRILTIENMEDVFSRLALIISGRPASLDTLPANSSFASSLLILREIMHHLNFEKINVIN